MTKIKLFIIQYNLKEIRFPSHKTDRKKVESSSKSFAVTVLYMSYNT